MFGKRSQDNYHHHYYYIVFLLPALSYTRLATDPTLPRTYLLLAAYCQSCLVLFAVTTTCHDKAHCNRPECEQALGSKSRGTPNRAQGILQERIGRALSQRGPRRGIRKRGPQPSASGSYRPLQSQRWLLRVPPGLLNLPLLRHHFAVRPLSTRLRLGGAARRSRRSHS